MKASFKKYILQFKQASGTSRGILRTKETFFLIISNNNHVGVGECAIFRGLSVDDVPDYEKKLTWLCNHIHLPLADLLADLTNYPSIQFGLEQAMLSLNNVDKFELFPSKFTQEQANININGLVWMGTALFMKKQIEDKLKAGFTTIKLKIGAIDFETEYNLLKSIRQDFSEKDITLRVDANGGFSPIEALDKLKYLADLSIHSIEQPIKVKQWEQMAELCLMSPLDIALDEELIGVLDLKEKEQILDEIKPQYIILKPSLIGGIQGTNQWIDLAKKRNIGWWITSALESNVGLNAIAQYTYSLKTSIPQGLGTGSLFTNNIPSPLRVESGNLLYDKHLPWKFDLR